MCASAWIVWPDKNHNICDESVAKIHELLCVYMNKSKQSIKLLYASSASNDDNIGQGKQTQESSKQKYIHNEFKA